MTKDELKREAEEKAKELCKFPINWNELDVANESGFIKGYLAGSEPREKRIAELEEKLANADYQLEGRDLKIKELEIELADAKKVQVVEHFEAYGQCRDSRRIAELEKENAELRKLKRECETSLCRAEYQYNYEQLTKTKEWIRRFINEYPIITKEVFDEAKEFLSEVVK